MAIYVFMRHGKAVSLSQAGDDEERWLTEEGKKNVEEMSKLIPIKPRFIYTSPLRRAVETAEIISKSLGGELKVIEELRPGIATCEALENVDIEAESVIIGHAPSIELIVSCIIGGGHIKIDAGGFAVVEAEEIKRGDGRLLELLSPRILRFLTRSP